MPSITSVSFSNGVNRLRRSSPSAIHAAPQTASSPSPATTPTRRTPNGRHVCATTAPAGALSEAAGMDVGDQDAPGTEVVELAHQPLGAVARHHHPYGAPAVPMKRRHGGTLDAGGQLHRGRDSGARDVVVHHHVGAGPHHALDPPPEHLAPAQPIGA